MFPSGVGFLWVIVAIREMVVIVTANAVAHWWGHHLDGRLTAADESHCSRFTTTLQALCKATTLNLGSVALSSFTVAVVEAARDAFHLLRRAEEEADGGRENAVQRCLWCLGDCVFGVLDRCVQFLNKWAIVIVGIENGRLGFCGGARRAISLFRERGIMAIINENLVHNVLMLGAAVVGVCTGLGGVLAVEPFRDGRQWWSPGADALLLLPGAETDPSNYDLRVIMGLAGAFVGFAVALVVFAPVGAAVTAVFYLFVKDPGALTDGRCKCSSGHAARALEEAWDVMFGGGARVYSRA